MGSDTIVAWSEPPKIALKKGSLSHVICEMGGKTHVHRNKRADWASRKKVLQVLASQRLKITRPIFQRTKSFIPDIFVTTFFRTNEWMNEKKQRWKNWFRSLSSFCWSRLRLSPPIWQLSNRDKGTTMTPTKDLHVFRGFVTRFQVQSFGKQHSCHLFNHIPRATFGHCPLASEQHHKLIPCPSSTRISQEVTNPRQS